MAQLTGFFQGTPQANTFLGKVLTADAILIDNDLNDPFKELVGIGADILAIDSFGGDDAIEAITSISTFGIDQSPFGGTISALGIAMTNANINTGAGADTFTRIHLYPYTIYPRPRSTDSEQQHWSGEQHPQCWYWG